MIKRGALYMAYNLKLSNLTARTLILFCFCIGFFVFIIVSMVVINELFNTVFPVLSTILFFMVKSVFDNYNETHKNNTNPALIQPVNQKKPEEVKIK